MIKYIKMDESNIDTVVMKYAEYYNNSENGCWTYEKAFKRIHQMLTIEDSLCYLQFDGQQFVGFMIGYYKEFDDLTAFYLEEIVIFAEFQNLGYGTSFLQKIQHEITENGASHIDLTSVNDLHHIHFYEKNGFYKAGNMILMGKHFD